MELARITSNLSIGQIYGLMGNINITTNNINIYIVTEFKFNHTVEEFLASPKANQALQMVFLDTSYLSKTVSELSEAETKKIILAKALISNKDYIVLDFFEKELTTKEQTAFKRLFKKLTKEYHKTLIIFTNDITFLWDLAQEIIYLNEKEEIKVITKTDYFELLPLVNKPPITEFIELVRTKNIKIENYQNVLDLLKAIYRIKGE